jgi:GntR family transcriptional regulator
MVLLALTDDPGVPLHDRIAAAVRRGLDEATLTAGQRLPAARDLADALDVHPNTVLRAYRLLRDEGLLDLRRGRGATLRPGSDLRAPVLSARDALLAAGARAGLSRAELARLVLEGTAQDDPHPPREARS